MDWLDVHQHTTVWRRAAGVLPPSESAAVVSRGQSSYRRAAHELSAGREGKARFVLTVENHSHFFEPATLIKKRKKRGLDNLLRLPKMTKRLARLLEDQEDNGYLVKN